MQKHFVAISRFTIANDKDEEVRQAFRSRPHLVDREAGFISMEVMSPIGKQKEIWLVTRWIDEESYRTWHRGHIVKAAIGLARELKIDVIVEGVETAQQLALLKSWGVVNIQGNYFSRPLPVAAIAPLLRNGQISPSN